MSANILRDVSLLLDENDPIVQRTTEEVDSALKIKPGEDAPKNSASQERENRRCGMLDGAEFTAKSLVKWAFLLSRK